MTHNISPPILSFSPAIEKKFTDFVKLLQTHNHSYNLIAVGDIPHIHSRHIHNSAQLARLIDNKDATILDLGSGAGFPGLILSILGYRHVTLIDANRHKCDFLKIAAKITETNPHIIQCRIEEFAMTRQKYDIITARALAPLKNLLPLAHPFCHSRSRILCLKGKNFATEWQQTEPHLKRQFSLKIIDSQDKNDSHILILKPLFT